MNIIGLSQLGLGVAAILGAFSAWGRLPAPRARAFTAGGAALSLAVAVACWWGGEGLGPEVGLSASLWAVAAGMVALVSARFQGVTRAHLARLLWGVSALLVVGAVESLGATRPVLPPLLLNPQAQLLALCAVAALAGGLTSAAVAAAAPTRDRHLMGEGWVLSACLVVALLVGAYGALGLGLQDPTVALPLTDPQGVPLEATATLVELRGGQPVAPSEPLAWTPRALTPSALPWVVWGVVAVAVVAGALGGVMGAARRRVGAAVMVLAGVGAGALGVWLWVGVSGPQPLPTVESLIQTAQQLGAGADILGALPPEIRDGVTPGEALQVAASQRLEGEQLLAMPTLNALEAQVQRADVAPAALLCLLASLLALYQAAARPAHPATDRPGPGAWPTSLHPFDGKLQPGSALLVARDAMQLAALLLWIGLGLCVLYSYEAAARYTLQPHQGLWLAVALTASASLWGFERAQARADRADFALWLALPLLTLLLSLLAAILGAADQSPALRLLP